MEELIKQLELSTQEVRKMEWLKEKTDLELKVMKAERGNETLQDRIKEKDFIISELKDFVQVLKPTKQKQKGDTK